MRAIILDRDGVINEDSPMYIKTAREWRAIPGSLQAIANLNHAGYRVLIAANQSGLAKGRFNIHALNEIHHKMLTHLGQFGGHIEAIFFCPHDEHQNCDCRKPRPGMLLAIADRLHISLAGVPVVGDKYSDILAAREVGARPILVRTGQGRSTIDSRQVPANVEVFDNLAAVADALVQTR
jgi:histidinol-phosphate phosphatase family domain/HAD-superfamily hydrolase, subfamily IIIA